MLGRLGRYDIERIIGSGGMGIVLKAHDSELNRPIAIKLLASHLAHVGAARERFAREARAAAAVVHEHVVAIYNVETDGDTPFLVMQYVPGRSLQTRVEEDGPLTTEAILRIGMQAASGLAAAHAQGLVHRDVKPSNILLEETVERAVLTDFGLARAIDDASLTQTGVLAGTPHYMSPEQATGAAIDHRSDLFSLGAVLYFMATGHPPFRAEGPLAVLHRICREPHRPVWQSAKEIPDELSDVIDRLLEKKPGRRFANAEEVRERLASLLSRAQRDGLGRRRFARIRRERLRGRAFWAAAAGMMAVVVVAGAVWMWPKWWPRASEGQGAGSGEQVDEAVTPRSEREFVRDWAESERAVGQSETATSFVHVGDAWNRELEALKRFIDRVRGPGKPDGRYQRRKKMRLAGRQVVCDVRGTGCNWTGLRERVRMGAGCSSPNQQRITPGSVFGRRGSQASGRGCDEKRPRRRAKAAEDATTQARDIQIQVCCAAVWWSVDGKWDGSEDS